MKGTSMKEDRKTMKTKVAKRPWTRVAKRPCSVCGGKLLMPAKADEPKDSTTLICGECLHAGR